MMGAFQGAFSKIVAGAMAGKLLEQKQKQAMQNVEDIKMAKLKQRAMREKYQAQIAKSKLAKIQAKQKTAELKGKNERITIGGEVITDPVLLKKIKETSK